MAQKQVFFPSLLRDLLIRRRMTPLQLASAAGLTASSVEAWLSASQIPKATSVWRVANALGGYEEELLSSALSWYHERLVAQYPSTTVLRFDKSASSYLGEAFSDLSQAEQGHLSEVWREILERKSLPAESEHEGQTISESIVLPKPSIVLLNEWAYIISEIAKDGSRLFDLPWRKFEDLVSELLQRYGWETRPMGYTKDDGIDIVALKHLDPGVPCEMMVQCKRLAKNRKVGVEIVREIWSVRWEKGFQQAMIATTSTFTRGAKDKGEKWKLSLKDHDAIVTWCKGFSAVEPELRHP